MSNGNDIIYLYQMVLTALIYPKWYQMVSLIYTKVMMVLTSLIYTKWYRHHVMSIPFGINK